ncbi:MAG: diguanylate cyclase domain-containing protein [Candidatus Nanopelagicales bacterium]
MPLDFRSDDWFVQRAAAEVQVEQIPSVSANSSPGAWATPIGRRSSRLIRLGAAAAAAAVGVLLVAGVLAFAGARATPDTAWLAISIVGFLTCILLAAALLLAVSKRPRVNRAGRGLAVVALGLAVLQLPLITVDPIFWTLNHSSVLVGPAGPRFLLAMILLSIAVALPARENRWNQVAGIGVILATGFGVLEVISYGFNASRIFWWDSQVGLPPASAIAICLIGLAVLLTRPDRPPLAAVVRAGPSLRGYWLTFFGVMAIIALSTGVVRLIGGLGFDWPTAATYGWSVSLIGVAAWYIYRGNAMARYQVISDGVQDQLRLLADNASDVLWLADKDGRCVWVSPALKANLGWRRRAWIGRVGEDLVAPASSSRLTAAIERSDAAAADPDGKSLGNTELQYLRADGEFTWMSSRVQPHFDRNGDHVATLHSLHNVQEQVAFREDLRIRELQLRTALDSSPVGTALLDDDQSITQANQALARIFESKPEALEGKLLAQLINLEDGQTISPNIVAAGWGEGPSRAVYRISTAGGRTKWCSCDVAPMEPVEGSDEEPAAGFVCQIRDVTNEVLDREELEFRAAHDRLTGLMNRESLETTLTEVLARKPRSGKEVGILYCDIDDFKLINDAHGHKAGDRVLRASAERISRVVRATDVVARIGGDEIVIIVDAVHGLDDCVHIGDIIREAVSRPLDVDGVVITPSISVGAALVQGGETPEEVLDRADSALYRAKSARRDRANGKQSQ